MYSGEKILFMRQTPLVFSLSLGTPTGMRLELLGIWELGQARLGLAKLPNEKRKLALSPVFNTYVKLPVQKLFCKKAERAVF
jgi:hypothetical protein